jgi:outer membrane lipoprotein-sorting protein
MNPVERHTSVRLLTVLLLACPLGAQSLDAVYGRLDKAAQQFKSMSADLRRNTHTAIVNDDSIETGTIRVKREKGRTRMLIEFATPDKKSVGFDGDEGGVYYPKMKTAQIYNVGDKKSLVDQILLLGFGASSEELKTNYTVTYVGAETVDGKGTDHIQLIPKSKDVLTRIKKAELWIAANGTPLQQRFQTSASGDFMLVTYMDVKANPPLSDGALKLSYPKDTKVEHPQL